MSLTVPFRPAAERPPDGDTSAGDPAPEPVRVGVVELRSAVAYLVTWAAVLFVVEVLVLWSSHQALDRLGVLASISRAAATALDVPLPDTGVLPALEFDALLPYVLVGAGVLSALWLLTLLAVVLVHNGVCAVTGGLRVRVR